ncbi:MAG: hypothetical protein WC869_10405 [Phycisphaerae bacterium]|jgi:hypothetical protein
MSIKVQAIRTLYEGTCFRSQTEAAWACWFDHRGIAWEYEPQCYYLRRLSAGYLPDFRLPDLRLWAEVKGQPPTEFEQDKARELAALTGRPVVILVDHPRESQFYRMVRPSGRWTTYRFSRPRPGLQLAALALATIGLTALLLGHWGPIPWLVLAFAALAWAMARRGNRG